MQELKSDLIQQVFFDSATRHPENIAFQTKKDSGWSKFNYLLAEKLIRQIATYLINEGINKNDSVAIIAENRPEWPIIYLGIVTAGAICVPLDTELNSPELKNLLNDCSCAYIFVSRKIFEKKFDKELINRLKKIIVLDLEKADNNLINFSRISLVSVDNTTYPENYPTDIASLIYTSGTTSQPKGVLLSHNNLCANLKSILRLGLCRQEDNFLAILPLHHTYAFMVTFLFPVSIGATVTYSQSLKSDEIINLIKQAKISVLAGVPHLFSLIHRKIFKEVERFPRLLRPFVLRAAKAKIAQIFGQGFRMMICGGARLESRIGSDLSRFFHFVEGYGLTETSPVLTLSLNKRRKPASVGRPIPEVEIKIDNPDRLGIGEVLAKGPNVMQGYFRQPELTASTIKNGWLFTGDLGYLDRKGFLFLTGRKKDVIVLSSGKNIYPQELEEHYLKSSYIKEICILSRKEERFKREIDSLFAVVVPNLEYFRKCSEINIKERIRDEINILSRAIPQYQHIMGFSVASDSLPRTRLNKIKRYQVKDKYFKKATLLDTAHQSPLSSEEEKILQTDSAKVIIEYLSKELKRAVSLNSHLEIDLGIDSLSRVELVLGLEEKFMIKIPDNIIYAVFTVRELIANVQDIIQRSDVKNKPAVEESKKWFKILNQLPSPAVLDKIRISLVIWDRIFTSFFKYLFLFLFRLVWSLKVYGNDNLPLKGPFIICANHVSYLDGFVIFSSLPSRVGVNLFFMGHAKIFQHHLVAWTVKVARVISIDPSVHLVEAMQAAAFVLNNKKNICIFPEGGRSISGDIQEFKKGVGILAKELNIPLIPVKIIGSDRAWPVNRRFPRPYPIKLVFGKPVTWQELGTNYAQISAKLRERIGALNV